MREIQSRLRGWSGLILGALLIVGLAAACGDSSNGGDAQPHTPIATVAGTAASTLSAASTSPAGSKTASALGADSNDSSAGIASKARTPEGAVELWWQYTARHDWQSAYALFHPDCQALLTEAEYAAAEESFFTDDVEIEYRVSSPQHLDSWKNPETGKIYNQGAAMVPVEIETRFPKREPGNLVGTSYKGPVYVVLVDEYYRVFPQKCAGPPT